MFCHNCGAQVPDDLRFCSQCGQSLASSPLGPAPAVPWSAPLGVRSHTGQWIGEGWRLVKADLGVYVLLALVYGLMSGIPFIKGTLTAGFHVFCMKKLLGRRAEFADLFTGFGLRTLSSDHPSYDPHSYQRGSVWPHDTMIAAAGMRRYGRDEEAWRLIDGILEAASAFDGFQLPELFAGLQRQPLDAPVPYERANVPQAWAAGSVAST